MEAVSRLARHLRRPGTRGLYVAATGTGKTLVSIRVTDELQARLVLFTVPTLDLAAQTAPAWRRDGHTEHMVIVSSMDAAGRDALVSARVTSSSDPFTFTLAALMSVVGEREDQIPALTLICTYDSLDKIQETRNTAYAVPPFDLAVMDEAHRIAGRPDKKWAAVHDNQRIRADRRLHTTATPRIFAAPDLAESAGTTRPRRRTPPHPARRPTCSPTPWTTNRSTAKRSSGIRWPRRSRTAGHRTTASWCPPSPTTTCAAASTSQHPTPTPTVRARDRTRPCAPPPRTWPCCAPSPATA
ncbi:DEAD/DEAH box helicase family protein [Streptomyces cyaneofuscatus]|uniref:DEAD/DEAH box helicase family protein n=1 Tax=Streptomyces cyaneofuscatus TaxID=66883 RepID=UPI0036D96AD0